MGYEHADQPAEPAQEVIMTEPPTNEHDVEIAKARAEAQVAETEAYAASRDPELEAENARLRGELEGMRTTLAALQPAPEPEPEPEPVITVAEVGEPAPAEDGPVTPSEPKTKKSDYWSAYR
jgi:hypothetical protein